MLVALHMLATQGMSLHRPQHDTTGPVHGMLQVSRSYPTDLPLLAHPMMPPANTSNSSGDLKTQQLAQEGAVLGLLYMY